MFYYIVFVHCQLFWTWGFPEIDSETAELKGSQKDFSDRLVEIKKTEEYIQSVMKDVKHFEKGGVVVTYYSKTGFIPKYLIEEVADEGLLKRIETDEKEIETIKKVLDKRKTS